MPQIAQLAETFSSQFFWLVIFFGLVYLVVGRTMLPQVMSTVDRRDSQISSDLLAAKAARDEAEARETEWRQRENANREEARSLIGQAKAAAAAANEAKLAEAQLAIDSRLAAAEQDIAAARKSALAEIEFVAAEAAQDIVARLTGASVPEESAREAVKQVMGHG